MSSATRRSPQAPASPSGALVAAGVLLHLLFWAAAALAGLPATYWDDSLILGPAVSIAGGTGLDNIYLSRLFYPDPVYLFYPPSFFFAVAGWIGLFGVSALSLSAFWALCGFVSSVSLAALLRRLVPGPAASAAFWALAPVLVFGCTAFTGYRYEGLGFATLFAGLALGLGKRPGVGRPLGYLLLFVTPTIAPTMLGAAAVAVIAVFLNRRHGRTRRELAMVSAALLVAVLLLVASVSGEVGALVGTMYEFRSVRVGVGGRDSLVAEQIFAMMMLGLATAGLQRWWLGRRWPDAAVQLPLWLVATMALTMVTHARPAMIVAINLAMVTVFIICLGEGLRRDSGRAVATGLGLWALALALLNIGYWRTVVVPPLSPAMAAQARAIVAAAPAGTVHVTDARVAKDALVYPTGGHVEDFILRRPWPAFWPDYRDLPANERWVVTRAMLAPMLKDLPMHGGRHQIDGLFIAAGVARIADDRICVLDRPTGKAWTSKDRGDLLALACGPAPEDQPSSRAASGAK